MKKTATALALALASTNVAALPLIDFWAGGYSWNTAYTGTVSATAEGQPIGIDLEQNLKLEDTSNNVIWAAFEHPVPLVPNVQIKQTKLESQGQGSFTQNFTFAGQDFSATQALNTDLNLNHTDVTAYWGLPLPLVTIDFGLNVRQFDGQVAMNGAGSALDVPVPMLFGRVGAELPFTGLAVMGEANYIGYGDTKHMDYQVVVRYTIPMIPVLDINVEAGYRAFQLEIDPTDFGGSKNDLTADIDMSGAFVGISFHL